MQTRARWLNNKEPAQRHHHLREVVTRAAASVRAKLPRPAASILLSVKYNFLREVVQTVKTAGCDTQPSRRPTLTNNGRADSLHIARGGAGQPEIQVVLEGVGHVQSTLLPDQILPQTAKPRDRATARTKGC